MGTLNQEHDRSKIYVEGKKNVLNGIGIGKKQVRES